VGKQSEGAYLKDLGIDGTIILEWFYKKWDGAWSGLI
jgi:hypothetical protein